MSCLRVVVVVVAVVVVVEMEDYNQVLVVVFEEMANAVAEYGGHFHQ